MEDFTKVVRLGRKPFYIRDSLRGPVFEPRSIFCKIKFDAGRLSITGVEGPRWNGECFGGCGQISMHMTGEYFDDFKPAPSWTLDDVRQFVAIWNDWHLNEMRPYTAAMKAAGWRERAQMPMLGYEWTLTDEAQKEKKAAEARALGSLRRGLSFEPGDEEVNAACRPYLWTQWLHESTPEPCAPEHYERARHLYGVNRGAVKAPERKTLGWLYPSEHPDGLLGATLNGEGYGLKWYREEVPEEVLAWLKARPDTDIQPAWV